MKHERIFEHTTNKRTSAKAVLDRAVSALEEIPPESQIVIKVTISYRENSAPPPIKDYRI